MAGNVCPFMSDSNKLTSCIKSCKFFDSDMHQCSIVHLLDKDISIILEKLNVISDSIEAIADGKN